MPTSQEQAVIVRCVLDDVNGDALDSLGILEDELTSLIEQSGVGELDGNEIGQGELVLYMYGPDAESLFAAVEPILRCSQLTKFATVAIRYGEPDAPCRVVTLG